MLDWIVYLILKGLSVLLYILPIGFDLWLGRQLGILVYAFSGKRARIAYANLKAAFYAEKSPWELKRITKNVYRTLAQTFAELIAMKKLNAAYVEKYIRVPNIERIDMCSRNKNGMILVSAHFGDWELCTATSSIKGYPLNMLARDQKMKRTYELLNELRESKGSTVIRKGVDVKNLFKVLRAGKGIGLLGDQNAGANGMLSDLFGRPASTAVGPYRMAQKCGSHVLVAFIHRIKGPYQEIALEEPFLVPEGEDLKPYIDRYNALLEKHVRKAPEQWLWMHKKWKMTDLKRVMILDDGKAGHLKQSLAAVGEMKKYRRDKGFSPDKLKVDIVAVSFRNKAAKSVFNLIAPFINTFWQVHLGLLKLFLTKESFDSCVNKHADVIVSTASSLAGVNYALKLENSAKNLTVMYPGRFLDRKFDLIIVPRHDSGKTPRGRDNIAITELAPNLIDAAEMASCGQAPAGRDPGKPCLGVLVGGDNKEYVFTDRKARDLARGIKEAVVRMKGAFFMTTSRRTPQGAESVLENELGKDALCLGFVSGRNDKDDKTVEKILAKSSIVVVSGESISMVSEAVSSGKPVLVFMPEKRNLRRNKYEDFVMGLDKRGYLKTVEPALIPKEASRIIEKGQKIKPVEDSKIMYDKMYRLF